MNKQDRMQRAAKLWLIAAVLDAVACVCFVFVRNIALAFVFLALGLMNVAFARLYAAKASKNLGG